MRKIDFLGNSGTNGDGEVDIHGATDWNWSITGGVQGISTGTTMTLNTGSYTITEDGKEGYHPVSWFCNNKHRGMGDTINFNLYDDQDLICTFTNARDTGNIRFVKEIKDQEVANEDWTFNISDNGSVKSSETKTLETGTYTITEQGLEGYQLIGVSGVCSLVEGEIILTVTREGGICTVTNEQVSAELTLVKTNDHSSAHVGDTITYTLKITLTGHPLKYMNLIDVLPEGFTYIPGSATVNGGIVNSVEPTLSNGGKTLSWTWGNETSVVVPLDQSVTVTYQVKISSDNQPSSYTNLAYVWGKGSPVVEGNIDDSVVKIDPVISHSAQAGRTGEVLGAATELELPATGSSTWFLMIALTLISSGVVLKVKQKRKVH